MIISKRERGKRSKIVRFGKCRDLFLALNESASSRRPHASLCSGHRHPLRHVLILGPTTPHFSCRSDEIDDGDWLVSAFVVTARWNSEWEEKHHQDSTVFKDRHRMSSSSSSFAGASYRWHLFPTRTKVPTSPSLRLYIPGFPKPNPTALMAHSSIHSITHTLWTDH